MVNKIVDEKCHPILYNQDKSVLKNIVLTYSIVYLDRSEIIKHSIDLIKLKW